MRWASRYCESRADDGTTFEDAAFRSQFVKAALIASDIWPRRVFSDKLAPNEDIGAVRRRAFGAFRTLMRTGGTMPENPGSPSLVGSTITC